MIVLLNYLPWIILAAALVLVLVFPEQWWKICAGTAVILIALVALTPSYFPKGTAKPLPPVELPEAREIQAKDVLLKPKPEELQQFEKKADWKERVEANKDPQQGT